MAPSIAGFYKNEDCPSSGELHEYQNGDLERERSRMIRMHLADCEFCDAEVEFYTNYPLASEDGAEEVTEIPAPLFELAEALLKNRQNDNKALNSLLEESKK